MQEIAGICLNSKGSGTTLLYHQGMLPLSSAGGHGVNMTTEESNL